MKQRTILAAAAAGAVCLSLAAVAAPVQAEPRERPGLVYTTVWTPVGIYSDTRSTGHYEATPSGLHIWTEGSTSTDKVAGYLPSDLALSAVADADVALGYASYSGQLPGAQLVVDISGDGVGDGILVGEPNFYGANWWLNNGATDEFKALDPSGTNDSGNGSAYFGTLDEWSAAAPSAKVVAVGFSLGSGAKGDGLVTGFTAAGKTFSFVESSVVVTNRDGVVVDGHNKG
ncbi:hypothetical protein [Agromyces mariniharenae]|uniref:Uncharacterized protein n=1 Tax=Agromyces mariniharenae TaxID=2604423 RepID=A0A5S4V065_9MICO|nr:hypothetical protein [Agromyces mariniharenae]TYL50721.1 hypothetical protein FYC51_16295 [Agromyces mariniharenae]